MKFSSASMSAKFDYDELENSIVDSLSEISIASTLPINVQNQNFINNTINDVISIYLWSNDFVNKKSDSNESACKKYRRNRLGDSDKVDSKIAWDSEKSHDSKKQNTTVSYEDSLEETNKLSPKVINNKKNHSTFQFSKEELSGKQSQQQQQQSKIVVPTLDFSYLQENSKQSNSEFMQQHSQNKDDSSNRKEKMKQKINYDSNTNVSPSNFIKDTRVISEYKSKNFDSIPKKNEIENQRILKMEIENLLKELKLIKHQSADINDYYDQENENKISKTESDKLNAMALNLKELLARLLEKRKISKRNMIAEKMNREEIHFEKIDTQKELLAFEEKHGRPQTKLEKDLMRPLYDHYRKVKRLLAKATGKSVQNVSGTPEDMDDEELNNIKDQKNFVNLHSLTLPELNKEKEACMHEKTKLKDQIKKYELEFAKQMGRALTKEDREYHKEDFERYKVLKAKLKLIDALIEKANK